MSAWNDWRQRRAEKEWQRRQRRNDVCDRCGMERARHGAIQHVDACNRFKPQEDRK